MSFPAAVPNNSGGIMDLPRYLSHPHCYDEPL